MCRGKLSIFALIDLEGTFLDKTAGGGMVLSEAFRP